MLGLEKKSFLTQKIMFNYGNQFLWDFGDGYSLDKATGGSAVSHYFNGPGVYNVTLSVSGTSTSNLVSFSVTGKNMYELPPILASPILFLPLEGKFRRLLFT
jgi:hypothetical protein